MAVIGDGVNDAPGNVGIADIILVNSKPTDITSLVDFGKAAYGKMIQNLFWATGYNIIAILLTAGVLYPHSVLSPALGAVQMSASMVIVVLNAQLLRRSLT